MKTLKYAFVPEPKNFLDMSLGLTLSGSPTVLYIIQPLLPK